MSATLAKSEGWNEKAPKSNQLWAPCETVPSKRKSVERRTIETVKSATKTQVARRKRISTKLAPKKMATETSIQMNWCVANRSCRP